MKLHNKKDHVLSIKIHAFMNPLIIKALFRQLMSNSDELVMYTDILKLMYSKFKWTTNSPLFKNSLSLSVCDKLLFGIFLSPSTQNLFLY